MTPAFRARPLRFRSIFISDCHLGSRSCRAEILLDFLARTESQHLFLVGDIFDVWSLRKTFFWPQSHNDVLRALLGKARNGTRVVYIPGNHDDVFRELVGYVFGNIEIRREHEHVTADGRRMLILHGVDAVVCGHIHHAATRRVGRVLYCNDGDWVESCTALVELHDGRLELLRWTDLAQQRGTVSQGTTAAA